MKSLRELRNNTINFGNVFKAFKEAEEYIRSLESLEETEKNLKLAIADLDAKHAKALQRNAGIDALYADAQTQANSVIVGAKMKSDSMMMESQKTIEAANAKVNAVLSTIAGHETRASQAKRDADAARDAAAQEQAKLDELKAHKARIVKSLSE